MSMKCIFSYDNDGHKGKCSSHNYLVIKKNKYYFISYSDFLPVTCSILTGSMWYRADAARMLYEN